MKTRKDWLAITVVVPLLLAVFACAATMTIGIRFARKPQRLAHHSALHVAYAKWNGSPDLHLTQNGRPVGVVTPGIHTFDLQDAKGTHQAFVTGTFYAGYVTPMALANVPTTTGQVTGQSCPTPKKTLIDDVF